LRLLGILDLEREGRRSDGAAAALHDRERSQEISDHALLHFEGDALLVDCSRTLEVPDSIPVDDHAFQR
jgi:hypothetical protein